MSEIEINSEIQITGDTAWFLTEYIENEFTLEKDFDSKKYYKEMKSLHVDKLFVKKFIKSMNYNNFLNSNYWKIISKYKKIKSKNQCQLCSCEKSLHTHHRTYKNHGDELNNINDLIVLCRNCHEKFHEKRCFPR